MELTLNKESYQFKKLPDSALLYQALRVETANLHLTTH